MLPIFSTRRVRRPTKDNHDHIWDTDLFFSLSEVFEDEWGRMEMNTALVLSRTDAYYFICKYNINDERLLEKIKWSSRLTDKKHACVTTRRWTGKNPSQPDTTSVQGVKNADALIHALCTQLYFDVKYINVRTHSNFERDLSSRKRCATSGGGNENKNQL